MGLYPVFMEMRGKDCLVVGGGNVATQKVNGLLNAEASVTVISPVLNEYLAGLKAQGRIEHIASEYSQSSLEGRALVMVATDDGAVNARVARDARARGIWINASDDPPNCDFILPAIVRKGDITIAVSTAGLSPAMARRIREELDAYLTDDMPDLLRVCAEVRAELRGRGIVPDAEVWQQAIDEPLRVLVAQRRFEQARAHLLAGLGHPSPAGVE
jgi:precorrin-2 dehydrogenase/sirohydrochlorin ferrochelatase